jgi:VWFA-related protein
MNIARISIALLLVALIQSGGVTAAQKAGAAAQKAGTGEPKTTAGQSHTPQQEPTQTPSGQPSSASPDAATPSSQQANQPPTFRAGVNFVRVDVIITDKKGQPAGDLTIADFQVYEDDKLQKIEQFKLIQSDGLVHPGEDPPREIRTTSDEEVEAARDDVRLFAIFFDDYHTRDISAMVVKTPLTQFVQTQLGPKDLVALMYPLTPLDAVTFTRNQDLIVSAIQKFEGRKYKYEPRNMFEEKYAHYPTEQVELIRNQVVIGGLRALATHLGSLREGRKAIIYVGEGFGSVLPQSMRNLDAQVALPQTTRPDGPFEASTSFFAQSDVLLQLRDVYDAANKNNTAIYTLDPRGLATNEFQIDDIASPSVDRAVLQQTQDTLRVLAEQTDGRAIVNRNDLAKGLAQIVRDSSAYYLLGYNSLQAPVDGKFHEIKVRLSDRAKSRGLQLRARRGYVAPTPEDIKRATAPSAPAVATPVQQALASMVQPAGAPRYVRSWIGMSRGDSGKTRVTYVWEPMPAPPGLHREQASRVSLLVANEQGDLLFRGKAGAAPSSGAASTSSAPNAPVDTAAMRTGVGAPVSVSFDLPPGKIEMRLAVEAAAGGVLDSEQRELTVPDLSGGAALLSTPRVYRARTVREAQVIARDGAAVPLAGRDFARTEHVIVRFDSYAGGPPSAVLLNSHGQRITDVPVTAATAGGTHLIDFPLGALATGEYVLEISAKGSGGTETKELVPLKIS